MPRIVATVLSVMLCFEPLYVVIFADSPIEGPLARSASREAARLAVGANVAPRDWENLQSLKPGELIIITTPGTTLRCGFIGADSTSLTVQRGEATERLNADDVLLVAVSKRRGSAGAAVLGTLGGIWLGSGIAYGLAENARCYSGCPGVRLGVFSAVIGVPIAGGYGAWRLSSRLTEEVVYRRQ